jgi:transcriptional regulator of arginine metabolism
MTAKTKRQNIIKELLGEQEISGYGQLSQALAGLGTKATQATLSRDFAEMGVIRIVTPDGPRYLLAEEETGKHIDRLMSFEILSVRHNESMVVVHTLAGRAQGVARYIEQLNRKEIIGTIGGYCTVLVIPATSAFVPKLVSIIKQAMLRA